MERANISELHYVKTHTKKRFLISSFSKKQELIY